MKMLAATMPTIPAAIHSIVSMKRSIEARFMSAPLEMQGTRRQEDPAAVGVRNKPLLRQGVVFGEIGTKFGQSCVRVDTGFLDTLSVGFDQRLGVLLPQRRLLRIQVVDLVTVLRLHLVDPGVFDFAPCLADAS